MNLAESKMGKRLPKAPMVKSPQDPPSPRTTIEDVARAAGVHPASVSRALRGESPKVSSETRARIKKVAMELGYRPNHLAAALRTKRTNLAAVVLPDLGNPLFAPIVQAIEVQLRTHGVMCLVAQTPGDAEGRCALIAGLAHRQVDGLLILAAEANDPMLTEAQRFGIPTVLVNRGFGERRFPSVVNDDRESVVLALTHLKELGHQHVAHIAGPPGSSTGRSRREAFDDISARLGLTSEVVAAAAFTREAGQAAAEQVFANSAAVTAVFAANDLIALGVLDALHARGLRVPADVSLVGHNDMPLVDLIDPPLTTIRIDVESMGRQAGEMLMEQLKRPAQALSMRVLTPTLVVRGSTGAVRGMPERSAHRSTRSRQGR